MRFYRLLAFIAGATIGFAGSPTLNEPDRAAWYRDAKFGMFIHWGPYSLASVEASWPIMLPQRPVFGFIAEPDYRALPQRFNPEKFDPASFVRLAKAAGQRYMVFTTKHHDGFCMFDSQFTDYKITKTPYGKDIAKLLADAAKKEGMPLGFYYSPPDMNHPGYRDTSKPTSVNWQGEPARLEWPLYLDYMELQLTELLTRYGDVAIVWFDGLGNQGKYNGRRFHDLIHKLQPATLINNRIGLPGDYDTPEQFTPRGIPTKNGPRLGGVDLTDHTKPAGAPAPEDFRLWETCMTINNTWAYNSNDSRFKTSTQLIRTLIDVASKGGNFLLNVGPTPEGTIQPEFEERLLAIGKWMQVNGDAIYGTTYGPLQGLSFGRTTQKGKTVYLHVFDWPNGALELDGLEARVVSVSMLAGGKTLHFTQKQGHMTINVPAQAPDPDATVLALRMK
jgi:alpha-L-fucosidase